MEIISITKPFKIFNSNKATTIFVRKILDNGPHMRKLHRW